MNAANTSNQTAFKPGSNQSGIGLPHEGKLAQAHSAAYIASVCPIPDDHSGEMFEAVANLKHAGNRLIRVIDKERVENQKNSQEIQKPGSGS